MDIAFLAFETRFTCTIFIFTATGIWRIVVNWQMIESIESYNIIGFSFMSFNLVNFLRHFH
jgi:hypothetical protein